MHEHQQLHSQLYYYIHSYILCIPYIHAYTRMYALYTVYTRVYALYTVYTRIYALTGLTWNEIFYFIGHVIHRHLVIFALVVKIHV